MPNRDPYVYPNTHTLINHFDIKDPDKLQELEGEFFAKNAKKPLPQGNLDFAHLKAIHKFYFGEVYPWAGETRTIDIEKGQSYFCRLQYIDKELDKLFLALKSENYLRELPKNMFCERLSLYFNEINAVHPFREGNGRVQRAFCDILANQAGYTLDWSRIAKEGF